MIDVFANGNIGRVFKLLTYGPEISAAAFNKLPCHE
jgi:hypothetical protein